MEEKTLTLHTRVWTGIAGGWMLLSSATLLAQGPPIHTDTAFAGGLEGAAFRSFVFSVRRSGLQSAGRDVPDPLNREVVVYGVPILVPYEVLKDRLVVAGGVPVLRKRLQLTRQGRPRTLSTRGFGDAFVSSKLLLLRQDRDGRTTRVGATGIAKFPTGSDDETDEAGNPLPPGLQLGSGSVDFTLGGALTHERRRVGFNADLAYHFRTEADGFAFGDSLDYGLALGYRLWPSVSGGSSGRNRLNTYLELNGVTSQEDRQDGVRLPDTGGTLLYLSPGIQMIAGNFILEASARLPVVQQLEGAQFQFHTGFTAGFRWLISQK